MVFFATLPKNHDYCSFLNEVMPYVRIFNCLVIKLRKIAATIKEGYDWKLCLEGLAWELCLEANLCTKVASVMNLCLCIRKHL